MKVQKSSIIVVGYGFGLDGSAELFHHCGRMCSRLDGCEYCAFLMSRSDISAEEDLHGGYAYNQHEKGIAL